MNIRIATASLLAALGLGACVLPGDFDQANQQCDEPNFDAPTRDLFCSGKVESEQVTVVQGLTDSFATGPIVRVTPEWMAIAHEIDGPTAPAVDSGIDTTDTVSTGVDETGVGVVGGDSMPAYGRSLDVKLHRRDGLGYSAQEQAAVRYILEGPAAAEIAMFGSVRSGLVADPVIAVLHQDRKTLGLLGLGGATTEFVASTEGVKALLSDVSLSQVDACVQRSGPSAFDIRALATFASASEPTRDYLMVMAECGSVVYGPPGVSAGSQVLVELLQEAKSVKIDESTDRLLIASGRDGLKIRGLAELRKLADDKFVELNTVGVPPVWPEDQANSGNPELGDYGVPVFDAGVERGAATSLAAQAASNVTAMELGQGRLYYINEATSTDGAASYTFLMSARLNDQNVADQFEAFTLSDQDVALREAGVEITYQLVGLEGSSVAVLRNMRTPGVDGEKDARASVVGIFDAPDNHSPTLVYELPVFQAVESIASNDGRLLVFDSDAVTAFTFTLGGNPL